MSVALEDGTLLHASCVAAPRAERAPAGVLILGPSGAGKSALALRLMALGARLVADDCTLIRRDGDRLLAAAPARLRGVIEARGVGLIRVPAAESAELTLAVRLTALETRDRQDSPGGNRAERAPNLCFEEFFGLRLPRILGSNGADFASVVFVLAQSGELLNPDQPLGGA